MWVCLDGGRFFSDASGSLAKGIRTMKNLKKLCFILSAGGLVALSTAACDDGSTTTPGTAGTGSGGTGTAGTGTAGTGTAGTGTAGTGTAGTGTAGTANGGAGGARGGAGGGGSGGASGGAPSADCTKWCSGAMGVVQFCAGSGLADKVNSEQKCIAHCTAPEASGNMGLSCWNTHLANAIKAMPDAATAKTMHCPHASGAPGNGQCNETM